MRDHEDDPISDPIIDELVRANPVPRDSLGELDPDHARQLLDRITGPQRPRARVTRRVAIAVLVAIGITAPLAFAAQRTTLLDFAFGDPAPKHVKHQLDHMLPPAYGPKEGPTTSWNRMNIVKGSERLVATTLLASGNVAHMYAVGLKNGGVCFMATGGPFDGGGCGRPDAMLRAHLPIMATSGWCCGPVPPGSFAVGATYAGRAIVAGAASIVVRYDDGLTDPVELEHGWFMYAVPAAHEVLGHEPVAVDVLNRSGQTIATVRDPFVVHRPKGKPAEKPTTPRLLARLPLGWHAGFLELSEAKGDQGHRCVRVLNTIDPIQTRGWWCGAWVGRSTAPSDGTNTPVSGKPVMFEQRGFTGDDKPTGYVYFRGWAGSPVARLELRFQNSTVQQLELHDGTFVYVVPPEHWPLGARPSYLVGRNASGRVVYRRFLYPQARCEYPGRDPRCKGLIFHSG